MNSWLAELLLLVHALLVLFVVLFPLVVLAGRPRWPRRPGWRITHLGLLSFIVGESWIGLECPLATWESQLRMASGQAGYSGKGWLADWLHHLLFFDAPGWVFTLVYTAFLAVVLLGFWRVPLRLAVSPPEPQR